MDKMTLFVALTGIAVLLQAGVLLAMYLAMRKSSQLVEELATDVKTKVMPSVVEAQGMLAQTKEMLNEARPKVQVIVGNLQDATTVLKSQVERVDATVNDIMDRARLQVIRTDELFTRTLDKVEETSEIVHKTVVSPVRQVSGLMHGITAGLEFFFAGRGRRNGSPREQRRPVPQDEMFI